MRLGGCPTCRLWYSIPGVVTPPCLVSPQLAKSKSEPLTCRRMLALSPSLTALCPLPGYRTACPRCPTTATPRAPPLAARPARRHGEGYLLRRRAHPEGCLLRRRAHPDPNGRGAKYNRHSGARAACQSGVRGSVGALSIVQTDARSGWLTGCLAGRTASQILPPWTCTHASALSWARR